MPTTIRTQYRHSGIGHNRMHGSPPRRVFTAVLQNHAHHALTNLRGGLVRIVHGLMFSRVGASSKPGAVHAWPALIRLGIGALQVRPTDS